MIHFENMASGLIKLTVAALAIAIGGVDARLQIATKSDSPLPSSMDAPPPTTTHAETTPGEAATATPVEAAETTPVEAATES